MAPFPLRGQGRGFKRARLSLISVVGSRQLWLTQIYAVGLASFMLKAEAKGRGLLPPGFRAIRARPGAKAALSALSMALSGSPTTTTCRAGPKASSRAQSMAPQARGDFSMKEPRHLRASKA